MGVVAVLCGAVALIGAVALWRRRTRPGGALVMRFTRLDRFLHGAALLSLGVMAVPGGHSLGGWLFVLVAVLIVLRRAARRVLVRRYSKLRGSVARFGRWHRLGLLGMLIGCAGLAFPALHAVSGKMLLAGITVHAAVLLRDRVALGAMAHGFVRVDMVRRRWPSWARAILPPRKVARGLPAPPERGQIGS